jgi:hypothetical protein
MPSCELFRKAEVGETPAPDNEELEAVPGKKIYDPETGQLVIVEETPTEAMDTIKWKNIPTDSIPPIQSQMAENEEDTNGNPSELISRGDYGTEFYTAYDVAIMLPFLSDRFNENSSEIYDNSAWALNFYGGMKMAMDELNDEGVKLNVTVMDSKANERAVGDLLSTRTELFNAHLIMGPYRKDNVELVADFAKRNNITYVSPHSAASGISVNNPNYIQVSPTLASHCQAITQHVRKSYKPQQVVLVARDKPAEKARFNYFQEENFRIERARHDSLRFQEYLVKDDDNNYSSMKLGQFIRPGETTVFIVPSWSNETFIYSFLAYAKIAKGMNSEIVVYGMPQWTEYDRIDFELYETLNVHISSDTYLDLYDTNIQFFRQRFFDRYGLPPSEESFIGYDVMKYFGRMLHKHGTKFQYYLEQDPEKSLHTQFSFERVARATTTGVENAPIERFENKFVYILKFDDYQFQPAE